MMSRGQFWPSDLKFFRPKILHGATLELGNSGVGWSVAPWTMLVYFLGAGLRPEDRLGLGVDGFLDHLIETF